MTNTNDEQKAPNGTNPYRHVTTDDTTSTYGRARRDAAELFARDTTMPWRLADEIIDGARANYLRAVADARKPGGTGYVSESDPAIAFLDSIVQLARCERDDEGTLSRRIIDAAQSIKQADYFRSVDSHAADVFDEIVDALKRGDAMRDVCEMLSQSVDGSAWIIYTARAHDVLALSDNDTAYDDVNGSDGATVEVRAFYAMETDVREVLERRLVGLFGDDCAHSILSGDTPHDWEMLYGLETGNGAEYDGRTVRVSSTTDDAIYVTFDQAAPGAPGAGRDYGYDYDDAARAALAWIVDGTLPPDAAPETEGGAL